MMEKSKIEGLVDTKIDSCYKNGFSHEQVVSEVMDAMCRMRGALVKEGSESEVDWDSGGRPRVVYYSHYIRHCRVRLVDIEWMRANASVFPSLRGEGLFRLACFRRRLSGE